MDRPRERRRVDGLEVARVPGPTPDTPTLVLLHEALGSLSQWRDAPERLAAATGWAVVAWSRRGYGRSAARPAPWPFDYHEEEATSLRGLLERLDVGPHVLWGHSDGATIALLAAARHPTPGLMGVVSVAGHVIVEPMTGDPMDEAARRFGHGDLRDRLARHHDHVDTVFWEWHRIWTDPSFVAGWDIRPDVGGSGVPTLVVQGTEDEYASVAQVRAIEEAVGSTASAILLDGVGHQPMAQVPERMCGITADFCASLEGGPSGG